MTYPITSLHSLTVRDFLFYIGNPHMKISFSQFGEDVLLHHFIFNELKLEKGFYVDVGCFHPIQYSNTNFLYMSGWKGLNIDAEQNNIDLFNQFRPKDVNICCGIGDDEKVLKFYKFELAACSTFSKSVAEKWQRENNWKLQEIKKLPVRPLNIILDDFLPKEQSIDYMNIDVEGYDEFAINSLLTSKYKPNIISIEIHDLDCIKPFENKIVRKIDQWGYRLKAICYLSCIFIKK